MLIERALLDEVIAHARAAAPRECCGVLLGTNGRATVVYPARNIVDAVDAHRRFEMDPRDHFAALRLARQDGLTIVGFYHSHPRGPERPSPTDVAEAMYGDLPMLIVSLESDIPGTRLFRIDAGNADEVPLVVG